LEKGIKPASGDCFGRGADAPIKRPQKGGRGIAEKPAGRFMIRSSTRVVKGHPQGDW
jgi:hypothetical protein